MKNEPYQALDDLTWNYRFFSNVADLWHKEKPRRINHGK